MRRRVTLAGALGTVLTLGIFVAAAPEPGGTDEIPPPLAPLEYLIGGWEGTAVPQANKLKGWTEKHVWAWKFSKGQPIGMTVEVTGGKLLAKGQLTFDPEKEQYRLDGTDPAGKPVAFVGTMDAAGKFLTLDRVGDAAAKEKERLRIRLLDNKIRYIMFDDRKAPGTAQFAPAIEVGLTKEGESLGGTAAADAPKCIVTGGAATGSITYNGKSYPLCCSGCRDEFNDNPEKYVKKALLRAENASKTTKASSTTLAKDDGSFEGLTDDVKPKPAMTKKSARPSAKAAGTAAAAAPATPKAKAAPAEEAPDADPEPAATKPKAKSGADPSVKAGSLLRQAQALEKIGNTKAALGYYRQLVADYGDTPQAKAASARIKALEKK